jgi:hypothetical protein
MKVLNLCDKINYVLRSLHLQSLKPTKIHQKLRRLGVQGKTKTKSHGNGNTWINYCKASQNNSNNFKEFNKDKKKKKKKKEWNMLLLLGICQALTTNIGSFFKVLKTKPKTGKKRHWKKQT